MEENQSWAKFPNPSSNMAESQITDEGLLFKDFKLTFRVDDAHCQIFAEKRSEFFSISLTNEEIAQMSVSFVASALELVDLMQTASKDQDPNLVMDISEDGVISISFTILLGNKTRKVTFHIGLQREEPGSIASCKRLFNQMSGEKLSNEGIMKVIESLITFNGTLEKKLAESQMTVNQVVQIVNELKEKDIKTQEQLIQQHSILKEAQKREEKDLAKLKEAQEQIEILEKKLILMESQLKEAQSRIEEQKKSEAQIQAQLEEVKISEAKNHHKFQELHDKLTEYQITVERSHNATEIKNAPEDL